MFMERRSSSSDRMFFVRNIHTLKEATYASHSHNQRCAVNFGTAFIPVIICGHILYEAQPSEQKKRGDLAIAFPRIVSIYR